MKKFILVLFLLSLPFNSYAVDYYGMITVIGQMQDKLRELRTVCSLSNNAQVVAGDLVIPVEGDKLQEAKDAVDDKLDELDSLMDDLEAEYVEGE